jgi:hypothetical protein
MREHPTATSTTETTIDRHWDRRPALTLLGVIVTWYAGTIAIVLTQAF